MKTIKLKKPRYNSVAHDSKDVYMMSKSLAETKRRLIRIVWNTRGTGIQHGVSVVFVDPITKMLTKETYAGYINFKRFLLYERVVSIPINSKSLVYLNNDGLAHEHDAYIYSDFTVIPGAKARKVKKSVS